ncbi:endolytic transglycosylase MltG [Marinilabiliaceae bacterium ANBcel2]|nr:endolytic transglycosylase MltG [Marinilabiliaceae bacterium ANBcel2]
MRLKTTKRREGKRKRRTGRIILYILTLIVAAAATAGYLFYDTIFAPNTKAGTDKIIYIERGTTFEELKTVLEVTGAVKNINSFNTTARLKNYGGTVRGGRYRITEKMSNNDLINMFRSGNQEPVNVTFNNIRTLPELAGVVSKRLESDSTAFLEALTDKELLKENGFKRETIMAAIIPDTYSMFWNTTPGGFIERMVREHNRYWNSERTEKAEKIGLTPVEVATLASIVDEETIMEDEKPRVAGLYINRLEIGMKLQADPTVRFAMNDFTVNRILNRDLETESPYNTYLYGGLPPGPIRMASKSGIEAVLNYEEHDYLYMSAKADFSGYHAFAKTLRQHAINANEYRRALHQRRIFR